MELVLPCGAEQAGAWAVLAEDGVGGSAAAREGAGMEEHELGVGVELQHCQVWSLLLSWGTSAGGSGLTHDQPMHS